MIPVYRRFDKMVKGWAILALLLMGEVSAISIKGPAEWSEASSPEINSQQYGLGVAASTASFAGSGGLSGSSLQPVTEALAGTANGDTFEVSGSNIGYSFDTKSSRDNWSDGLKGMGIWGAFGLFFSMLFNLVSAQSIRKFEHSLKPQRTHTCHSRDVCFSILLETLTETITTKPSPEGTIMKNLLGLIDDSKYPELCGKFASEHAPLCIEHLEPVSTELSPLVEPYQIAKLKLRFDAQSLFENILTAIGYEKYKEKRVAHDTALGSWELVKATAIPDGTVLPDETWTTIGAHFACQGLPVLPEANILAKYMTDVWEAAFHQAKPKVGPKIEDVGLSTK